MFQSQYFGSFLVVLSADSSDSEGEDLSTIRPTLIREIRNILDLYPDDGQILKVCRHNLFVDFAVFAVFAVVVVVVGGGGEGGGQTKGIIDVLSFNSLFAAGTYSKRRGCWSYGSLGRHRRTKLQPGC
jgi:hypothetical protein